MDITPASDPRVRVELTFHPEGQESLTVSLPRWDYLTEATMRGIKAALRRFRQDQEQRQDEIRRAFRRYQVAIKKYDKALTAWEKRLDDPTVDDPGDEPEEPARPDFGESLDGHEVERLAALFIFKEVLTPAQYKVVAKCTNAEIALAKSEWDKASETPLGELLASPTSLTESTEGPSVPTSSPEDGPDATSESDSHGQTSETS